MADESEGPETPATETIEANKRALRRSAEEREHIQRALRRAEERLPAARRVFQRAGYLRKTATG